MLTRRAVLAVGGLSLTGCSVDSLRPEKPAPTADHDAVLVRRVRNAMEKAHALAVGTPFADLHAAQLAALGPTTTASSAPTPATPAVPPATPDQIRASEAALQQRLLTACRRAQSGQLASVFASMAAGIAQELA